MRWLERKPTIAHESAERGAAGVTVALMLLVLIGAGALAVDTGQIYAERAQLQNAADSSALAVAKSCAKGSCNTALSGASSIAGPLANANSNDSASTVKSIDTSVAHQVTVATSTKDGTSGAGFLSKLFASALTDAPPATVGATATAGWGGAPLTGPATLPMTFAPCQFDFSGKTIAMFSKGKDVNCAGDSSSSGKVIPGGFEFIKTIGGKCTSQVYPPSPANADPTLPYVNSGTGASMPSECSKGVMASYVGQVVLIPVFSGTSGTGDKAVYYIKGFAAFFLEGFKIGGSDCAGDYSLIAAKCGGSENGIQGHFQKWVADSGLYTGGGYTEGGATLPPQLIK
jgi:Flp pilus assembly protein TadG